MVTFFFKGKQSAVIQFTSAEQYVLLHACLQNITCLCSLGLRLTSLSTHTRTSLDVHQDNFSLKTHKCCKIQKGKYLKVINDASADTSRSANPSVKGTSCPVI